MATLRDFLKQRFSGRRVQDFGVAMLMGGPAFLLLILFMIWPFFSGFELSLTNQRFSSVEGEDVGWRNYDQLLSISFVKLPDIPDQLPDTRQILLRRRLQETIPNNDYAVITRFEAEIGTGTTNLMLLAKGQAYQEALKTNLDTVDQPGTIMNVAIVPLPPGSNGALPPEAEDAGYERIRRIDVLGRHYAFIAQQADFWNRLLEDSVRLAGDNPDQIGALMIELPNTLANLTDEQLLDLAQPIWWYPKKGGELEFEWDNLDAAGLGEYEDWSKEPILSRFELGGNQYAIIAKDSSFFIALRNNLYFAAVVVPVQTSLALLMAMLVNQRLRGMEVYRTIYFSPVVTAMVIIAVVWQYLYNYDGRILSQNGLINQALDALSGGRLGPYDWLHNPKLAMPSIMVMSIWQGVGFQMIIFLAGLQDIPKEMYEAASIDGAGVWGKFRFITLPMLRNTTIFVVITTTILAFRLFDQINILTPEGGTDESTKTMVWLAVKRGYREERIGQAAAISVVFVLIVLAISIIQRTVVRSESAWD